MLSSYDYYANDMRLVELVCGSYVWCIYWPSIACVATLVSDQLHVFIVMLHICPPFETMAQQLGFSTKYIAQRTISQTDGARSSRVPIPLLDDPYMAVSSKIAKAAALSPSSFRKRYRSSYEIPSPSSSLTLPIRKRYRGKLELVEDTKDESLDSDTEREGLENEGPGAEEEEAAPEGPQQAVPVVDTTVDEPSGLGYGALRRHELALVEGSMPSTFEIGESSRSVLEQQRVEETPAPRSPVRATWVDPVDGIIYTDITIIITLSQSSYHSSFHQYDYPCSHMSWCVEEVILEVGAQLELHRSILHDHT
ncbi:hypothetical protein Tco_0017109 [Tanacetum coccineum]